MPSLSGVGIVERAGSGAVGKDVIVADAIEFFRGGPRTDVFLDHDESVPRQGTGLPHQFNLAGALDGNHSLECFKRFCLTCQEAIICKKNLDNWEGDC